MPRVPALLVLALLAAGPATAEEPPGVALLVRDAAAPALAVDGAPVQAHELRARVAERLGAPPAVALALDVAGNGSVRVTATAFTDLAGAGLDVGLAATTNGVVVAEAPTVPVALRRDIPATVDAVLPAAERVVAWIVVRDDPTGRFHAGEVLQAVEAAQAARADRRVVLVEAARCGSCAPDEAAARAAASEFAEPGALDASPWRYARPLDPARLSLAAALVGVAALVLVPWRPAA